MTRGRHVIAAIALLTIGFVAGFVLRPAITPLPATVTTVSSSSVGPGADAARGTQYFEANIEEARRVAAACRDGTIRGDECSNAETAVDTFESRERFKRFRTDQR